MSSCDCIFHPNKVNPLEVFVFYRVASAACLMSSHPILLRRPCVKNTYSLIHFVAFPVNLGGKCPMDYLIQGLRHPRRSRGS